MRTLYKCRGCEAEMSVMTDGEDTQGRRCHACGCKMSSFGVDNEYKTPWYPVPAYIGAKGHDGEPHVLNRDGELVAVFERIEDAELAADAANTFRRGK